MNFAVNPRKVQLNTKPRRINYKINMNEEGNKQTHTLKDKKTYVIQTITKIKLIQSLRPLCGENKYMYIYSHE
jgi:hypothetical protein